MNKEFKEVLTNMSLFPPQNVEGIYQAAQNATEQDRPFKIGCYVCLPSEWDMIAGRLVYNVSIDPTKLSRLEQPQFVDRSLEILSNLDGTGLPFRWDFIIADTDPKDVFGDILKWDPRQAIIDFQARIKQNLVDAILPEATSAPLWSDIQKPYNDQYWKDFDRAYNSKEVKDDIEEAYRNRLEYYRRFFASQGLKVHDGMIAPICRIIARKNKSLYAAQTPIYFKEYDLLVIGDRDPVRLGTSHSLFVSDARIWYPYPGR